jgi:hypothetical protein
MANTRVCCGERRKGLNRNSHMGYRVIGHIGSPSVLGLVEEPPKRMRLMCPLSMPTLKVISGQGISLPPQS